jgi:MSHA biogenesis protein MshQ
MILNLEQLTQQHNSHSLFSKVHFSQSLFRYVRSYHYLRTVFLFFIALFQCEARANSNNCLALPTEYGLYASNQIKIQDSPIKVNGNSINTGNYSDAAIDQSGNVTTNANLILPSLSPSSYPANAATNMVKSNSNISIHGTAEAFYKEVKLEKENTSVTFTGGGTLHIDKLETKKQGSTINFAAGTYFINDFKLTKEDTVINITSSPVVLHIGTQFRVSKENVSINQGGNVSDFIVYLHSGASFRAIKENLDFTGLIYGPNVKEVKFEKENTKFRGAIVIGSGSLDIKKEGFKLTYTNADKALLDALLNCDNNSLDHFQLHYSSSNLTCLPSDITLKACANSDCSSVYSQPIDATLSAAGIWSHNPISVSAGQSSDLTFQASTAGDTTLAISASSVTPANPIQCYEGGVLDADCSINFSDAGFVFDVPTLTACKTSANVTIKAVQTDNQTNQCVAALTGSQSVNFFSSYSSPNSGTTQISISGTAINTTSPGTAINLNFNQDGEATFSAQYDDAGEVRLDAEFDNGSGLTLAGNDNFISKPAALYVYTDETNANCDSSDASCSLFKKAGSTFDLKVKAACWQADNDTDYSDNPITPNFELDNIGINANLIAPINGTNASLGTSSIGISTADAGIHSFSQSVSEVGVFSFTLSPPSYFGETLTTANSAHIGRFYPDHFVVSAQQNGAFGEHQCGSFTYTGQHFNYQTKPTITVAAHNSLGQVTTNYHGDFAKLSSHDFTVNPPTTDANALGADGVNKVNLNWLPDAASLIDNGDGSHQFSFGNDRYIYPKTAHNQVAPFSNAVTLNFTSITDTDGVATQGLPVNLQPSGETIRFGRLSIDNAHGSEQIALPVGVQIEYFDGINWKINNLDQCTALQLSNHVQLANSTTNGNAWQNGSTSMTIDQGNSSANLTALVNGETTLTFSAPGTNNQGYINIKSQLNDIYNWLLDDRDNDGNYDDEAKAKASFGVFKGSDRVIFRREVY